MTAPSRGGMRANYSAQGVQGYYEANGSSYRNPHFAGVQKVIRAFLDCYWPLHAASQLSILDLAAGAGEATLSVQGWRDARWPAEAVRSTTDTSRAFIPPNLKRSAPDLSHLPQPKLDITATDPFTQQAYTNATALSCCSLAFSDLAQDHFPDTMPSEPCHLTICSFALHLITDPSELWALLQTLQHRTRYLVVVAPHKLPHIKDGWGFARVDPRTLQDVAVDEKADVGGDRGDGAEIVIDRVRLRVWRSLAFE